MKTYTLTARPLPSCLAYPWEADLLKGKSVTVQLVCGTMGKINRNRIQRLVMPELRKQFGHLCRIGGYTCGELIEVGKQPALACGSYWNNKTISFPLVGKGA